MSVCVFDTVVQDQTYIRIYRICKTTPNLGMKMRQAKGTRKAGPESHPQDVWTTKKKSRPIGWCSFRSAQKKLLSACNLCLRTGAIYRTYSWQIAQWRNYICSFPPPWRFGSVLPRRRGQRHNHGTLNMNVMPPTPRRFWWRRRISSSLSQESKKCSSTKLTNAGQSLTNAILTIPLGPNK